MWQPIETAPKDRQVLLYCPRRGVVRGWWDDCRHSSKPRPYWTHDRERMYGVRETRDDQPTHWMPLPDAPGAQTQPAPSVPKKVEVREDDGMIFSRGSYNEGYDNGWNDCIEAMLAAAPEANPEPSVPDDR